MSVINRFEYQKDRVKVHFDNGKYLSIRERTFKAMDLFINQEISFDELKDKEVFFFKQLYSKSWGKEKLRINRIKDLINYLNCNTDIITHGFGADSNEYIPEHPEEAGKPDLEIRHRNKDLCLYVEVSGTEFLNRSEYWIRPDKIEYCKSHKELDIWFALHYQSPKEKFVFIKPNLTKSYSYEVKSLYGADEYYVIFNDFSEEVRTWQQFGEYFKSRFLDGER